MRDKVFRFWDSVFLISACLMYSCNYTVGEGFIPVSCGNLYRLFEISKLKPQSLTTSFSQKAGYQFIGHRMMEETAESTVQDAEYYPREKYGAANLYAAKKTVAQGMMDVALITANANQLRFIVEYNQSSPTYVVAIILIAVSLILQILVGLCLIFKGRCDLKGEKKFQQANAINNCVVVGVFLITIVNVFVAAFSTTPPPPRKPE